MLLKELVVKLGLEVDESTFAVGEHLVEGLKGGLFGLVAGLGAVVVGFLEIGRETANAASAAGKLAVRLGTTTDAAQELAFAAEATGSSTESLQTSMFHMSRAIEAARSGSAEAQKAIAGLGVPLEELVRLSPDEQFEALAEGLKKTSNQGQKATKAQAIFGRGVLDLLPLINKGKEGIQGFREEAQELGIVLSEQTIKESKEWKMQNHILAAQMEALKYKVGAFVVHGVMAMSRAWKDFQKAHPDLILKVVTGAVVALTAMTVAYGLANAAVIGGAIAGYAALGFTAMLTGVKMAAAWLLSIAPIAAAAVGVLFLYLALNDIYHFLRGDGSVIGDILAIWKNDIHSAGDAAAALLGTLKEIVNIGDWQGKAEKERDAQEAEGVDRATFERRRARGVIDASGNPTMSGTGALAPFTNPSAAFSPAAAAPAQMSTGFGAMAPVTNNFEINQQPGQDPQELAGMVAAKIEEQHKSRVRAAHPAAGK